MKLMIHKPALLAVGTLLVSSACTDSLSIETRLVNPCNQVGLDQVDFLKFEPRGTGVDSQGLSSIQPVTAGASSEVPLPLVDDFSLVVTGHVGSHENPVSGIGVSPIQDITKAQDVLQINIPFGLVNQFYRTTDLNDPITCTEMNIARTGASTTYLPAHGKVLIVGGETLSTGLIEYRRSIEFFDPATGRFEIIGELRAGAQRAFHSATLLADGRVLVAGGEAITSSSKEALASALLITITEDGRAESEVVRMPEARTGHTAVRLADNRVVLIGGRILVASGPQDETRHTYHTKLAVFDPANGTGQFVNFGSGGIQGASELRNARFGHSSSLLPSGREILVVGGYSGNRVIRDFEVISLLENQMSVSTPTIAGAQSAVGPIFHAATVTESGQIVLSGGYDSVAEAAPQGVVPTGSSRNVELWDFIPNRNQLQRLCNDTMQEGRGFHTVSTSGSQAYFVGGRLTDGIPTDHTEVVTIKSLAGGNTATCFEAPGRIVTMDSPRSQHNVVELPNGELLILGGKQQEPGDQFGTSLATAEIFSPFRTP